MKVQLLTLAILVALGGCASTSKAYKQAESLDYPNKPSEAKVIDVASQAIRPTLKDPDSLKNLQISNGYKCYPSKTGVTDNISPKYDYGHWCFFMTYSATNSYGGYVKGYYDLVYTATGFATVDQVGEVLRKSDDVWTFRSPMN